MDVFRVSNGESIWRDLPIGPGRLVLISVWDSFGRTYTTNAISLILFPCACVFNVLTFSCYHDMCANVYLAFSLLLFVGLLGFTTAIFI